jgi:hypothetical protein
MAIKTIALPYCFTFLLVPISLSSLYSTGCEHSTRSVENSFVNIERKDCTGALALVTINYEEIAKFSFI